jgi:hypothetical protein
LTSFGSGITQATSSVTLSNIGNTIENIGAQSLIQAGVQTTLEGGSFGRALLDDTVNNAAAVGANAIGDAEFKGEFGTGLPGELAYLTTHAGLGCAASALEGTGCSGGAVGGAASALVAPLVRDGLYGGTQTVTTTDNGDGTLTQTTSYNNSAFNALTTGIAMLTGGVAAGLTGTNAQAGTAAAQNEVLNNTLHEEEEEFRKDTKSVAVPLGPRFGASEETSTNPETGAEAATETVGTGSLVAVLGSNAQGAASNGGGANAKLPIGYTMNFDGTVTGPGGGRLTIVATDGNGAPIFQRLSGVGSPTSNFFSVDSAGKQVSMPSPLANGNSFSTGPTTLYRLYDSGGNFLKWGISNTPGSRYTATELNGGYLDSIGTFDQRSTAAGIERYLSETQPGPLNLEPWAGKAAPGNPNYDPEYLPKGTSPR